MNLRLIQLMFLLVIFWQSVGAQVRQEWCIQDAVISVTNGQSELFFCEGDGIPDVARFRVRPFAQPFAYLVTDETNTIVLVSTSNIINFEGLGKGSWRVWAFAYLGNITAQVGQNIANAELATICWGLTQNFIPVGSITPNGGTVATSEGRSSVFVCPEDGVSDVVIFTSTSNDPFYRYVITDANNRIVAFVQGDRFDFETLDVSLARVWGVSFVGNITAQIGDDITAIAFADRCADRSDNFIEVTRAFPNGGQVTLSTGETSKTICAENLGANTLSVISNTAAQNAYAFVVTDEAGRVLLIEPGRSATLTISAQGICRVYGVSYTGLLTIAIGDNINDTALSNDCYDLSDNFITVIKREVDGATISLVEGSNISCVVQGAAQPLVFSNTSMAEGSNYAYLVTDTSNVILAFFTNNSLDISNINARNLRVWGLSYSGNLSANIGDNAGTAALSNQCYDLSDNFIAITRKVVNGSEISLESGATEGVICSGDGRPDLLAFRNNSTSLEAFIYIITDENNVVIGFISGHQLDFETITVNQVRVWGLSYSGPLQVQIGDNLNDTALAGECFDLSDNFVALTRKVIDGGTVALANGAAEATVCGDDNADELSFTTSSASTEDYVFVITDTGNIIIALDEGSNFDFETLPEGTYRVWGLSFTGNITANVGDNAALVALTDECYDLSSNFVIITKKDVDGATVSFVDGSTEAIACPGDVIEQEFTFFNTSDVNTNYTYLITNENNVIIAISNGTFSFTDLPAGAYRVWGLSYTGNLTAAIGDDAAGVSLSDECFNLSDNFIRIAQIVVDGGTVALSNGSMEAVVCGDGEADERLFVTSSAVEEAYAFVITDEANIIVAFADGAEFDFETLPAGTYRVWGLSFTGNVLATIGDDAAATVLTDECYDLSDNFVTIIKKDVDGATVSLGNGANQAVSCLGDNAEQIFEFSNTSTAGAAYSYLITNEDNIIVGISNGRFRFEGLPAGTYRVWGLSYTGNLVAAEGDDVTSTPLSDECFDLSDNVVRIEQVLVDGGSVSLLNGRTEVAVCGSSSTPGPLTFTAETASDANYVFLITTENNRILVVLNGNSVDFNVAASPGRYRVWGLSYTGNLLARVGDNAAEVRLSSECFALSANFVSVIREETNGGTIAANGGTEELIFCPGNGKPDLVSLTNTGNSSGSYAYLVTTDANVLVAIVNGNTFDFDALPEGRYRLWGLAFTGNILVQPGQNVSLFPITNQCADLSDNFVSVVNEIPTGGTVALSDNRTEQFTCPGDGNPDIVQFFSFDAKGRAFAWLITDGNNVIEAILTENSYDFESETEGVNRIWRLAYSGNLTAQVGDNAASAELSDDCFSLSQNFIEIIRETPKGGGVSLENGETNVLLCANDNISDILQFDSTGTSRGSYIYVITDENNVIRNGILGDKFDFSFLPPGTYRVWGLAFTGTLTAGINDVVTNVPISNDCYNLSDNFVTVTRALPLGGTVAANGTDDLTICANESVTLSNNSIAVLSYIYLITDTNNRLLGTTTNNTLNTSGFTEDAIRVWGLSYNGTLLVLPGDDITAAPLSDGCFNLSNNFVTIRLKQVDGSRIGSNRNSELIFTCFGDGVPDVIAFNNNSTASGANYIYVITNVNNSILGTIVGNSFNFETAGVGVGRVWGVSYTGTFTAGFGTNILSGQLSSECFDVSENFITVARDRVLGGEIATSDGAVDVLFCPSPAKPGITFRTTSNQRVGYQFIVTNTTNDVIALPQGNTINFMELPVGAYRVWGVSYTGDLLVKIGDNLLGVDLASSCFEISASFVAVYRSTMIDGGMISNVLGDDSVYVCPNNFNADLIALENNSQATEATYRYILTNANNIILLRNIENDILDFDNAMPGEYRIWGVSFTGEFTALAADNAATVALSDSCYALSANFITVFVDRPNGGLVATTGMLSSVQFVQGAPATVAFMAQGASKVRYQYIVTDTDNVILAFANGSSFDFTGFALGTYRVWGLAYTGELTAQIGNNAAAVNLSDDCFDLSDNFVEVRIVTPFDGSEPLAQATPTPNMQLSVAPNPASHRIQVQVSMTQPQDERGLVRILSLTGQVVYETNVQLAPGRTQFETPVQQLPDGMYILQVRNGNQVQSIRFIKQWQ